MKASFKDYTTIYLIKIKVFLALLFLKNTNIKVEKIEEYHVLILEKWAKEQGMQFCITRKEIVEYLKGHHFCSEIQNMKYIYILHFSK